MKTQPALKNDLSHPMHATHKPWRTANALQVVVPALYTSGAAALFVVNQRPLIIAATSKVPRYRI